MELWVILGPTAVGKSQVAVEVAGLVDGEVIVADSMQVYRGLDIGTAKLREEEKIARNGRYIVHHLVDIIPPDEPVSVAAYQKLARKTIEDVARRGKVPLLVGGTALYLRAVMDPGYRFPPPGSDKTLREALRREGEQRGSAFLHEKLAQVDPATAARLHPNDVRRIVRALEVYYLTGQPFSLWHSNTSPEIEYELQLFGLNLPRPLLYTRIEQRAEAMLAEGWVEEVKGLLARGYDPELPALQGLGYRHIVAYLQGKYDWGEMFRLICRDTRRFAKRQLTWFRRDERIRWLDVSDYAGPLEVARKIVALAGRTKGRDVEYTNA